jgi:hypothetical protein
VLTARCKQFPIQWNFSKSAPQKISPPWISADFFSPCPTFLSKGSLRKPATSLNRPFLLVPVLASLEKFVSLYSK